MAASSAMNRGTTGVVLPNEVSSEIWKKTVEESAVMQLARRIELPGAGLEFPMITGEPTANWVNETEAKPVSNHTAWLPPLFYFLASMSALMRSLRY